ncbi:MAG: hypothetical protein IIT65_05645 [Lachnospiraceae bacterium]|nr:hypothetical protein [Lachnospiraceae bacterium]
MINNLETLSVEIHNKISNLLFEFVEHNNKTNQSYPIDLQYAKIKYMDKNRVVFHGNLIVSFIDFGTGYIEYDFINHEFYRVSFSDKTYRSRRLFSLIPHNLEKINDVIEHLQKYKEGTLKNQ